MVVSQLHSTRDLQTMSFYFCETYCTLSTPKKIGSVRLSDRLQKGLLGSSDSFKNQIDFILVQFAGNPISFSTSAMLIVTNDVDNISICFFSA